VLEAARPKLRSSASRREESLDSAVSTPSSFSAADADPSHADSPRERLQARIKQVWREALGIEKIEMQDDFFAIGGDSLVATQVVARLSEMFSVALPIGELFESPTIEHLAAAVENLLMVKLNSLSDEEVSSLVQAEGSDQNADFR
jgi:acyl carrier protein